jgi:hypothetical protein
MKTIKNSIIGVIMMTIACLLLSGMIFLSYDRVYRYQVKDASKVSRYLGDINADFQITWEDVTALEKLYLYEDSTCTEQDKHCADLNQDGAVNQEDTAILLLYMANSDSWTLKGLESYCRTYQKR